MSEKTSFRAAHRLGENQCEAELLQRKRNRNHTVQPDLIVRHYASLRFVHYDDVIMDAIASQMTSLASVYSDAHIKENIKALRHWPLCGEFTGDR